MNKNLIALLGGAILLGANATASANDDSHSSNSSCSNLLKYWNSSLFTGVVGAKDNGGYGLPMWAALVDVTGKVCGVFNSAGSGASIGNHSWLGSRVISIQKATTANSFSLDAFSISTANLYGLTQPGGSLFGLQLSNPVDPEAAYLGSPDNYGKGVQDPAAGKRVGGINVFGGGLALYDQNKVKIGAIGVSGDTSCTDHAVAWKLRAAMVLDHVPGGFISGYAPQPGFATLGDEMIINKSGNVANTYQQPSCAHNAINNPDSTVATGVIFN